ncbi:MAG: DUF2807 domain-containing protein [Bacteroidia bacterium]
MKRIQQLFLPAIMAVFFSSCEKDHAFDCFKNTGETITVDRPAAAFNRIEMNNNVDLVVHFGAVYSVNVTAGANIINGITTEIIDNVLYIKNDNKCNWVRSFNTKFIVDVTTDDLINLVNNGSGNVTFEDTLRTYEFIYDNWNASGIIDFKFNGERILIKIHTGTADINIGGTTGLNYVYLFGFGNMNCKDLNAKTAFIVNMGSGDCSVRVSDELNATIESIGSIYYTGSPSSVTSVITGTGKLIHE